MLQIQQQVRDIISGAKWDEARADDGHGGGGGGSSAAGSSSNGGGQGFVNGVRTAANDVRYAYQTMMNWAGDRGFGYDNGQVTYTRGNVTFGVGRQHLDDPGSDLPRGNYNFGHGKKGNGVSVTIKF